jgi:hypothetical protein
MSIGPEWTKETGAMFETWHHVLRAIEASAGSPKVRRPNRYLVPRFEGDLETRCVPTFPVLGTFFGPYAAAAMFASSPNPYPISGEVVVNITSAHVQAEPGELPIAWIEGSVTVTGIPGGTLTLSFGGGETQANYPALAGYTYEINLTATNSNYSDNFYIDLATDANGRPIRPATLSMTGVLFEGNEPVDTWHASDPTVALVPYTPPPPPQIAMNAVSISSDGQTVVATYTIEGSALPVTDQVAFYWATGPSVSDEIESTPVYEFPTRESVGVGQWSCQSSTSAQSRQRPKTSSPRLARAT